MTFRSTRALWMVSLFTFSGCSSDDVAPAMDAGPGVEDGSTGDGQDGSGGDGSSDGSEGDGADGTSDGADGSSDGADGTSDGSDGGGASDGDDGEIDSGERCPGGPAPDQAWMEHWFEHVQNMQLVKYDDCAAIYFDADMDRQYVDWITDFVSRVWAYSLKTYGYMGEGRVYALFHQGKYFGGHPAYWFNDFHDFRNTSDVGGNDWREGNYDVTSHEIGHIVESTAAHTKYGSPAFGLWGDSKWMEFYQYDVYLALGMTEHAQVVFDRFTNTTDDFPRAGTHWFRDWFYPLWRDYGHARVMVNFFSLLEQHFPAGSDKNMRRMNWGEYIHFTSGAAGTDLKTLATQAFGWPDEWEREFQKAKQDFPDITY